LTSFLTSFAFPVDFLLGLRLRLVVGDFGSYFGSADFNVFERKDMSVVIGVGLRGDICPTSTSCELLIWESLGSILFFFLISLFLFLFFCFLFPLENTISVIVQYHSLSVGE